MQTKDKLPPDVKTACISYVRGYERRVKEYHRKRDDIIKSGGTTSYDISRIVGGEGNDEVFNKTLRLQKLEKHFDTKIMRAVEQAKNQIGVDLQNDRERQKVIEGIVICCKFYKTFNFYGYKAKVDLHIEKTSFYRYRNEFLYNIYDYLENS